MHNLNELTIDWNRCIHVDNVIDDTLYRRLTPQILKLRQDKSHPITVGINSPGGSLTVVESLLHLLTGPDQDGRTCSIITVAINQAYSAAANLLAAGNYAVALPESEILFHDVRFGGIEDVTPSVAKTAVNELLKANTEFSLKLANNIFRRLVWNYIDLRTQFDQKKEQFEGLADSYSKAIELCKVKTAVTNIDIAGFAITQFSYLSSENDELINSTISRLRQWGGMMGLAGAIPNYRSEKSDDPGLLDGTKFLYDAICKVSVVPESGEIWSRCETDFKLYIALIIDQMTNGKNSRDQSFSTAIDRATEDFKLIDSINDPKQIKMATRQLLKHKHVFFEEDALEKLENGDEETREAILKEGIPNARLFWHFCVLLCGELFNGEHRMSPAEAQILGLIDEVIGGGPVENRREFRRKIEEIEKRNTANGNL